MGNWTLFSASTTGTLLALLFRGSCILKRVAEYLMKLKWYDLEWGKTNDINFYLLYFKKIKICFKIASCQIEVFYSLSLILLD